MSEISYKDISEWIFPSLDDDSNVAVLEKPCEEPVQAPHVESEEEKQAKINLMMRVEIESIREELMKKMGLVDSIVTKFENPLSHLDNELIELIQYIVKKAVKSLIYKEIKTDKKIINKIVKELVELVNSRDGLVTVSLSESDYKRMSVDEENPSHTFTINPELMEGDVIVKSNFGEIRAILNERVNQVLGVKYV